MLKQVKLCQHYYSITEYLMHFMLYAYDKFVWHIVLTNSDKVMLKWFFYCEMEHLFANVVYILCYRMLCASQCFTL